MSINEQALLFLTCVQTGIIMGMFYDLIRIFRKIIPHPNWLIQVEDLLYWITCACFAFIMIYWKNYGQIRGFAFIGILIGGILYFCTLSIVFMKIATWTIDLIKRAVIRIIKIILIPIRYIIKIMLIPYMYIAKICSIINLKRKAYRRKVRNKWIRQKAELKTEWRIIRRKR